MHKERSAANWDGRMNFRGGLGECVHQSMGHWAWCHDCDEWCRPNVLCHGCLQTQVLMGIAKPLQAPGYDEEGRFVAGPGTCRHSSLGQRSWCLDCGGWCYPSEFCAGCRASAHGTTTIIQLMQQAIGDIRQHTGWSNQRLAMVVGSNERIIGAIQEGVPLATGYPDSLLRRLHQVWGVVERASLLTGGNTWETDMLLSTAPLHRRSAIDELARGDVGRAYLAVFDILRPSPPGLLAGRGGSRQSAPVPLHE